MPTFSTAAPTAGPALKLDFFGGPILWRADVPVRISPFQAGLLSLALGIGRSRIPRATIQSLLWNSASGKAVRHRLSQLVYQTNQRCQTRVFNLEGEYLQVNPGLVATDLEELKRMLETSRFKEACDLFERGFLSAFPNRKTEAFADWIDGQEQGLRARLRKRALADWRASEAGHDWLGASASAEALSRLDPNDEDVLRRVIRAHAMGGRVGEAAAGYRSFAGRSDSSGNWAPQRSTTQLLESLETVHEQPSEDPPIARASDLDIPFVGRPAELSRISRSFGQDGSGNAWSTVTVSGEAGLGKTGLVNEALRGVQVRSFYILHANPGELERSIPLSALLEALNTPWVGKLLSTVSDPWRSHLMSLLPQFDSSGTRTRQVRNDRSEWQSHRTCGAFLRLFRACVRSKPAVVVMDDFHWVDEATVVTLHFLQRRWQEGNLTLLLSYRPEDLERNPSAERLVNALESEPNTAAIRLRELETPTARELVASMGRDELGEATVSDIVALAGGNPRFLIQIATDVVNRVETTQEVRVPRSVSGEIVRRIRDLGPNAGRVMSALAVFDTPTTIRCLTAVTGRSRHDCIDALDLLDERRLIEWVDGRVDIRQEIVRRTVYEGLSPTRRSLLHALAAEVLSSRSQDPRPGRIAKHYHRAGDRQLAHFYALEAAKPSAMRAPGDRLKFLTLAYETGEKPQRRRLIVPLARTFHRSRRLAAAIRSGQEALNDTPGLSQAESSTARLVVAEARSLFGQDAPATTLGQLTDLQEARKGHDEVFRTEVLDATLRVLRRAGDEDGVRRLFGQAKHMQGFRDPVANCRILATLAMQAECDDPAEGLVCARRAVTIARELGVASEQMLARQRHITALAANGLLATGEGRTAAAEVETAARNSDDLASYLMVLLELTRWYTATGGLDLASSFLDKSLTLAEETDCPEIRCLTSLACGNLALARGNLPAAAAAIERVSGSTDRGLEEESRAQDVSASDRSGQKAEPTYVHPYLAGALAALQGRVLLETGSLRLAAGISKQHPVEEPLTKVAIDLILFRARYLSRKGKAPRALDLLLRSAEAHETDRPIHWLRLTRELVRLARRKGNPRPALATMARERALHLDLPGLAHEFVPFIQ